MIGLLPICMLLNTSDSNAFRHVLALDQVEMLAGEYDFFMLIKDLDLLNHIAMIRTFGIIALFADGRFNRDGIADEDGTYETDAIISVGKGDRD